MSDEHGAQYSRTYGHPFIETPNMDRLAQNGTTFDSAYCNAPLCVPSRISFMTGQFNSRCEGWDNAVPMRADAVTWPHLLRSAGYDAVLAGKMHLVGLDNLHGFRAQLSRDIHSEMSHPIYPWEKGLPAASSPWAGVVGTGTGVPGHEGPALRAPEELKQRRPMPTGPGRTIEIDIDDATEHAAVDYLRNVGSTGEPFALCVGFIAPHFPFVVPDEYFNRYFPKHADLPNIPPGHLESLPAAAQRLRTAFGFSGHTENQVARARAAYYGLVTYLDDKIGTLLNVLDEMGLSENTVVIHASDHGELLGEHGLWRKMSFYEQAARVPLQIRWPAAGRLGQRFAKNVSLVDVTATILDLAGVTGDVDGASLREILAGDAAEWKDEAFSEHNAHGTNHPRAMIKKGKWKLCATHADPLEIELYDLESDPGEFTTLASDRANEDVLSALLGRLHELWNGERIEEKVIASQRCRMLIQSAVPELQLF